MSLLLENSLRYVIMELYRIGMLALLVVAPPILGFTQAPRVDDPAAGERLAVRWCSSCHLVKTDQAQANADAPSFGAMASMPDYSAERLATFLMSPHPKMPSYSLSRIEAQVIVSYIESLAKPAPKAR
jgi:mono/diheme cytochrome c family protein